MDKITPLFHILLTLKKNKTVQFLDYIDSLCVYFLIFIYFYPFYFSVYNFPQTHLFSPPFQLTFYSILWLFPLVWSPSLYPLIRWCSNPQISIAKLRYSIWWSHNVSLTYIFFSLTFASQSSLSLLYYLLYM